MEKSFGTMELFIPSLLAVVLAAVVVMFLLPRLSPVVLGSLALVFLVFAAYQHYTFFGTEYHQSTWQLPFVQYEPYILMGSLILFLLFFIMNFVGVSDASTAAPLAAMNAAVQRVASQIPTTPVLTQATNVMRNAANNAMKAVGMGQNQRAANQRVPFSQV